MDHLKFRKNLCEFMKKNLEIIAPYFSVEAYEDFTETTNFIE